MQITSIEEQPRTGDANIFIGTMADGSKERVIVIAPLADDWDESEMMSRVRAEIERRVAARGR